MKRILNWGQVREINLMHQSACLSPVYRSGLSVHEFERIHGSISSVHVPNYLYAAAAAAAVAAATDVYKRTC